VKLDIKSERKKDWEQWVLFQSDEHIDNPKCRRDLHKFHLEQAKERNAAVFKIGDYFDVMQGKSDKRSSKSDLLPDIKSDNYINELIDFGYKELAPYKDQIAMIVEGNHESAYRKYHEYNLIQGLARDLQREGSQAIAMGYRGYIRFQFNHAKCNESQSLTAYWTHGYGGGGPVTKGVIQVNRKAVYLKNVDMVFQGHIHERWVMPVTQVGISQHGVETSSEQTHIQLPTYKDEFTGVSKGWHHERGGPPKPLGGWWVKFYWSTRSKRVEYVVLPTEM
jgi:hypothetical protein